SLLCLYLVGWSLAIIVQRLTHDPAVLRPAKAVEDLGAFLLPAATLHIALSLAVEGRRSGLQNAALVVTYLVCGGLALGAVFFPDQRFSVTPPNFELPGVPGEVFGWGWIAARILIFVAAIIWIAAALRTAGGDRARRRGLVAAVATVFVGAAGGVMRFLPGPADTDPWIGVSLVTLAMILAAYAVFAQGVFLAPEVAGKAFRYSVAIGVGLTVYVAALVGLERLSEEILAIDFPVATGLAIVITIALFDPIANRARALIGGDGDRAASARLLRVLGRDLMTAQRPESTVQPALERLTRTFRLTGAQVVGPTGASLAQHGAAPQESALAVGFPLERAGVALGTVTFGPKRSQLPFTHREVEILSLAAGYLSTSLGLADRVEEQAEALTTLEQERTTFESEGEALRQALTMTAPPPSTIHVFALGPLRAERGGTLIGQWGGAKAGTRQAEAIFAFLFDRGERGASKDEMVELIWPDVDLERADLAFHRTLGGLRSTLKPGREGRDRAGAITFHNDRYRLDSGLIEWSDVVAFEERMASASAATDPAEALLHLERARSLYRGEYLDDCPFYGDSSFAEERRDFLRGRFVDLLLALGARYEARNDLPAAAACYRQARQVAGEEVPVAEVALDRLGSAI
ncbi:MAG: hypothetical protein WD116_00595, partial [Chloroflexota bacterium]